jgi:hypothetical protein
MNHCEHCTAKLGDFDTVCEYGVGFSPRTPEQAAAIYLEEIAAPFDTSCGGYTTIEWFADAQHPNLVFQSLIGSTRRLFCNAYGYQHAQLGEGYLSTLVCDKIVYTLINNGRPTSGN